MADDRTVAPSPSRIRRAWEAGLRPRSHWLGLALRLVVVAMLASTWDPEPNPALVASWAQALASAGAPSFDILGDTLVAAGVLALTFAAIAVGAHVAVTLLTGGLGPADAKLRRGLRVGSTRAYVFTLTVVSLVALAGFFFELMPVVAGASRAADAPALALGPLFRAWIVNASVTGAGLLAAAGLVELALERRRRDRSLHRSVAETRDDLRDRGRG